MKFKIALLMCYFADKGIFTRLVEWYLKRQGFDV